ncbi:MAG: hypothetical protein JWO32_353 [Bacteroidetes bacterium]|nr:hypothetical protein [Bacteroidota bacterium]
MKTSIITCALILSASLLAAQNENKPVKVRIKKVENINGVETITDTTFTTTDPSSLNIGEENISVIDTEDSTKKVIIIKHHEEGNNTSKNMMGVKKHDAMDEEIAKALKEAGADGKGTKKVVIINENKGDARKSKTTTKTVIIKTDINDASSVECKKAGITESKEKLIIAAMACAPNPSNGKFNLKFTGTEKTSVSINVKDINGKTVYTETVKQFNGTYDKEINLDGPAKGIYFVTIAQGQKATTKKLIVE